MRTTKKSEPKKAMDLAKFSESQPYGALAELAREIDCNVQYLYQLKRRERYPSREFARRLINAERARGLLTLGALLDVDEAS